MLLGLAWAGNLWLGLWLAPVALALLTSPAQSVWTSRSDLGRAARARGLFLTADDTAQAPELAELVQIRGIPPARPAHRREPADPRSPPPTRCEAEHRIATLATTLWPRCHSVAMTSRRRRNGRGMGFRLGFGAGAFRPW